MVTLTCTSCKICPARGGQKFCKEVPVPCLRVQIVLLFRLLGGELTVAHVLTRTVRPDVGPHGPLPSRAAPDAAHQVLEGGPHFLVLVGVDAGVHDGVEHRQQQQPALQLHDVAGAAVEAVQQEHHQAGGPAEHEGTCNRSDAVRLDVPGLLGLFRGGAVLIKIPGNKNARKCGWKRH